VFDFFFFRQTPSSAKSPSWHRALTSKPMRSNGANSTPALTRKIVPCGAATGENQTPQGEKSTP